MLPFIGSFFVSVFLLVSSQYAFYYSDSDFFSEMVVKATELVKVNDTATGKILYPIKVHIFSILLQFSLLSWNEIR